MEKQMGGIEEWNSRAAHPTQRHFDYLNKDTCNRPIIEDPPVNECKIGQEPLK
ncbi:MAG: hypothetical protein QXH91_09180 [Candidatus Bathyarchaeia archaeon]